MQTYFSTGKKKIECCFKHLKLQKMIAFFIALTANHEKTRDLQLLIDLPPEVLVFAEYPTKFPCVCYALSGCWHQKSTL